MLCEMDRSVLARLSPSLVIDKGVLRGLYCLLDPFLK